MAQEIWRFFKQEIRRSGALNRRSGDLVISNRRSGDQENLVVDSKNLTTS
jgi:hypothetical protein